jgi:hypothetical protein
MLLHRTLHHVACVAIRPFGPARPPLAGLAVAFASVAMPLPGHTETCGDYSVAPRVVGTILIADAGFGQIATVGHHAIVTDPAHNACVVIDVSSASTASVVATLPLPEPPEDITIDGDYAYIAVGTAGLQIADVSTPALPAIVGSTPVAGGAVAVTVSGSFAYVGTPLGLYVVDVSDPAAPAVVGSVGLFASDVATLGTTVYVGGDELRVVDASVPTSPVIVGSTAGAFEPVKIALSGDLVLGTTADLGVVAFDVSAPGSPSFLSSFGGEDLAVDVAIANDVAFVTTTTAEFLILNAGDPSELRLIDALPVPAASSGVLVSGGTVFVAGGDRFSAINVTDLTPLVLATVPAAGSARRVVVDGGSAFVVHASGLDVFDVTSVPPIERGSFSSASTYTDVEVLGDHALLTAGSDGLRVVDVGDPGSMSQVAAFDTPGLATGIALAGVFAVVADGDSGIVVIDVTDPLSPSRIGSMPTAGAAEHVIVQGTIGYVAEGDAGVEVFDLSNPASPAVVGSFDTPGTAVRLARSGFHLYVADGFEGLVVADVSSPSAPMVVGQVDLGFFAQDVVIDQHGAYVADAEGLFVVDITIPALPTLVGSVGTLGDEYGVAAANAHVFLTGDSGLSVCATECGLVPIVLSDFQATFDAGEVSLSWIASFTEEYVGFYVYRSDREPDGYSRLNDEMISGAQGSFTFVDDTIEPVHTYYYRLSAVDANGVETYVASLAVQTPLWGDVLSLFAVASANPMARSSTLRLILADESRVDAAIHDVSGRLVRSLLSTTLGAGVHEFRWDGRDGRGVDALPGVYVATVEANGSRRSERLVLVR